MTENHTEYGQLAPDYRHPYGRLHPDYGTELRPDHPYGDEHKDRVRRQEQSTQEPNPQAKYALLDFVLNAMNRGLMVDLRPTVKFMDATEVYHWFADYLDRVDKDLRDRARSALNTHQQYKASQNKPAREEIARLKEQVELAYAAGHEAGTKEASNAPRDDLRKAREAIARLTREKEEAYEKGVQEALKNATHNPAIRERMRLQYEDGVRDGRDQVLVNADNQFLKGHTKGYKDGFKDGREGAITELATVVLTKKDKKEEGK